MQYRRRQFLQGAGGFSLALPWLPSLWPRAVEAQTNRPRPRFVAMNWEHGAVFGENMFPANGTPTETMQLYSDHPIRRYALKPQVDGALASLSPVLTADSSKLTPRMASKMNVLRGMDTQFHLGHQKGGYLGNYAGSDGNAVQELDDARPTIDQVMAYSSSFYSNLTNIRARTINLGASGASAGGFTWGYSNPETKTGSIQSVRPTDNALQVFNNIFMSGQPAPTTRAPIVDRVIENYRRLRGGSSTEARRISAADRQRLDDHMQRLSELQRLLTTKLECGSVTAPTIAEAKAINVGAGIDSWRKTYQTYNDVVAAAFACGASRIATLFSWVHWSLVGAGSFHQDYAHMWSTPDRQPVITRGCREHFESVFLDLAYKLDVEEINGTTYLDNTLMQVSHECGEVTHDGWSIPVVTAGSASGFLKTGNYIDYRRTNGPRWDNGGRPQYPGLLYNQWLATALQAVGLPASEFERAGEHGYGSLVRDDRGSGNSLANWPQRLTDDASKIMPFLKA